LYGSLFLYIIHLGYLGFDDQRSEVFIPNREILDEFKTSTKSKKWVPSFGAKEICSKQIKVEARIKYQQK